jgi:hypothetical protein
MAISSACFFGVLRTEIGASVQFSRMIRCGKRLKCWNTMPISRRTSSIFFRRVVSSTPSTIDAALLVLFQPVDATDHSRLAGARGAGDDDALAEHDLQVGFMDALSLGT